MSIQFVLCRIFVITLFAFVNGEDADTGGSYEELVMVNVSFPRRHRRSAGEIDQRIDISFPIKGYPVSFLVERNDMIIDIPVSILNDGRMVDVTDNWDLKQHIEAYQNVENGAAFNILYTGTTSNASVQVLGIFVFDGKEYSIQPAESTGYNMSASTHRLTESVFRLTIDEDYIRPVSDDDFQENARETRKRFKRDTESIYTVELLLVLDYSVYQFWNNTATPGSKEEVWNQTQTSIFLYFMTMINGMDARYRKLQEPQIRIQPVGIIITTDPTDSYWTLNHTVQASPRDEVDALVALREFRTWSNGDGINPHDHAMLVTKYNLTYNEGDVQGLAFLGAICGNSRQSILEDKFDFILAKVATHEVGHSLGSKHDGDTNLCNNNETYIMSSAPGTRIDHRALHPWLFSNCSIDYFKAKLESLNSGVNGNCLRIINSPNALNISQYVPPFVGQVIDADSQCRLAFGNTSRFCTGFYGHNFTTMCTRMRCEVPGRPGLCNNMFPADGTPCADRKICMNGVCSHSPDAPPKVCYTNHYSQYCSALKDSDCYSEYNIDKCCKTCKGREKPSLPSGCSYGDSKKDCNITNCHMYSTYVLHLCCETCAHLLSNDEQTYKDGNIQCKREIDESSSICGGFYRGNYTTLCERLYCKLEGSSTRCTRKTASDYTICGNQMICIDGACVYSKKVPKVDCISDKQTSYCTTIGNSMCYSLTTKNYCCVTCNSFKKPHFPPGCTYGDKIMGCHHSNCSLYSEVGLKNCCGTCYHVITTSSTTTRITRSTVNVSEIEQTVTTTPNTTSLTTRFQTSTSPSQTVSFETTPVINITHADCQEHDSQSGCVEAECSKYNSFMLEYCCKTCQQFLPDRYMKYLDGNVQCKRQISADSLICGGFYRGNYTSLCSRMYCRQGGNSTLCSVISASDYTLCGKRMVCIGGVCRHSDNTPLVDCISNRYSTYCAKVQSWECYDGKKYDYCCKTCDNYKRPFYSADCVYGDKATGCQAERCTEYDRDKRDKCCGTCALIYTTSGLSSSTSTLSTTIERTQSDFTSEQTDSLSTTNPTVDSESATHRESPSLPTQSHTEIWSTFSSSVTTDMITSPKTTTVTIESSKGTYSAASQDKSTERYISNANVNDENKLTDSETIGVIVGAVVVVIVVAIAVMAIRTRVVKCYNDNATITDVATITERKTAQRMVSAYHAGKFRESQSVWHSVVPGEHTV